MVAAPAGSPTILLTGATGQVGSHLLRTLATLGTIIAPSRAEMDLADPEAIRTVIRAVRPRWIVNPGAYTAVDRAEHEPVLAYAVNETSVRVIGEEAATIGAAVIHFSTDYVFPGMGTMPYREADAPEPLGVYGASKLAGERALAASGAAYLVFRTSWVYGANGKNFLTTILKLAQERESLRIVADQHGAPTWSYDLAEMAAAVMRACEASVREDKSHLAETLRPLSGLYHAAADGETTWHGFATEAIRQWRAHEPSMPLAIAQPIATVDYPTPAKRPLNSRLDCRKLAETFGWRMPAWQHSLSRVMDELHNAGG